MQHEAAMCAVTLESNYCNSFSAVAFTAAADSKAQSMRRNLEICSQVVFPKAQWPERSVRGSSWVCFLHSVFRLL